MNPETVLYLHDAVDEVILAGEFKFDDKNVDYLIDAHNALRWYEVDKVLPEALEKYMGRSAIPCLVVVSSRGRKPRVTVAQRRWDKDRCRWVWSRHLNVLRWKELPDV